jgi:RNA polymerase sigma-70 factor (ECF subfamily)
MTLNQLSHSPSQASGAPAALHLAIAQSGDPAEFGRLIEPYRRELLAYCYRFLGSPLDAEDVVQETLLRAWRRRETFNQPVSFRAWLYKIATNSCLNALEKRPRRALPITLTPPAGPGELGTAPIREPIWLEPIPDEWLPDPAETPEARYSARESISLAFLTALQLLPPRQRAVLILREVLDWPASEAAELLGLTVPAVNSALHRARATVAKHYPAPRREPAPAAAADPAIRRLLERYMRAWETADIAGLVSLLREEATLTMPAIPTWYRGPAAISDLLAVVAFPPAGPPWEWRLLPTQANGQPALAIYRRADARDAFQPFTLQVLTLDPGSGQIDRLANFRNTALLACFGFPLELTPDGSAPGSERAAPAGSRS